jgi:hypothetical protein
MCEVWAVLFASSQNTSNVRQLSCRRKRAVGNTFSGYICNDQLNSVCVDGDIAVVIAANASRWPHHAGYFESIYGRFSYGKKQALDLRGQLYVLKEVVPLSLNRFGKRFPLLDIPLDDVNNKGEA